MSYTAAQLYEIGAAREEVTKFAAPFTKKAKAQRQDSIELHRSVTSRKERAGAALGGVAYTAAKAPKGRKKEAAKEYVKHVGSRPLHSTPISAHAAAKKKVSKSAFGVEGPVSKANSDPSKGRYAAGAAGGWIHSAVAAKKGQKLRASGSSAGHEFVGNVGGSAAGARLGRAGGEKGAIVGAALGGAAGVVGGRLRAVKTNQRAGRYKPQS